MRGVAAGKRYGRHLALWGVSGAGERGVVVGLRGGGHLLPRDKVVTRANRLEHLESIRMFPWTRGVRMTCTSTYHESKRLLCVER